MNYTHYDLGQLSAGTVVVIGLRGTEANVQLLDGSNFASYQAGRSFRYTGGHYRQSPVRLQVPHTGHWHVAVDLGGMAGNVESWIVSVVSLAA